MDTTDLRRAIYLEFKRGPVDAQAAVVAELMPLARNLRIVVKSETLDCIIQRMLSGNFEVPEIDPARPDPKKMAAVAFWGLMSGFLLAAESRLFGEGDSEFMLGTIQRLPEVKGYMRAMVDIQAHRAGSGADARRAIGADKKAKVWLAAQKFRGHRSKEQAAPLIAEKVGLSPATVRRMIIQMFPGQRWAALDADPGDNLK